MAKLVVVRCRQGRRRYTNAALRWRGIFVGLIEAGFWLGGWADLVGGHLVRIIQAEGLSDFADLCGVAGWVDG